MAQRKTHLRRDAAMTLCGRAHDPSIGGTAQLIGHNEIVDKATCQACQRADDALQIREYEKDRKAAGAKPGEWF